MEPPLPLLSPSRRPNSSAITRRGSLPLPPAAARTPPEPFHARLASGCGSHSSRTISRSPRLRLRLALLPNHFTLASPPAAARTPPEPFHARLASGCGSHYHRIKFSSSTERRRRTRQIATRI